MPTEQGDARALAEQQRRRAVTLTRRLARRGVALDGSPASLTELDAAVAALGAAQPPAARDELAAQVGAYAGEALLRGTSRGWVLDDAGLPAVELPGRARVRVTRRAARLLAGGTAGMAELRARLATAEQSAGEAADSSAPALPLGDDRPLGLRRSALGTPESGGQEERADDAASFARLVGDTDQHSRTHGWGPSLFVWLLLLCAVAVAVWAAYLYRHAPP